MPKPHKKVKPLSVLAKARLESFGPGPIWDFFTREGDTEGFAIGLEEIAELIRHRRVSLRFIRLAIHSDLEER